MSCHFKHTHSYALLSTDCFDIWDDEHFYEIKKKKKALSLKITFMDYWKIQIMFVGGRRMIAEFFVIFFRVIYSVCYSICFLRFAVWFACYHSVACRFLFSLRTIFLLINKTNVYFHKICMCLFPYFISLVLHCLWHIILILDIKYQILNLILILL